MTNKIQIVLHFPTDPLVPLYLTIFQSAAITFTPQCPYQTLQNKIPNIARVSPKPNPLPKTIVLVSYLATFNENSKSYIETTLQRNSYNIYTETGLNINSTIKTNKSITRNIWSLFFWNFNFSGLSSWPG